MLAGWKVSVLALDVKGLMESGNLGEYLDLYLSTYHSLFKSFELIIPN